MTKQDHIRWTEKCVSRPFSLEMHSQLISYMYTRFTFKCMYVANSAIMFFPLCVALKCYSEDTGISESDKGIYIWKKSKHNVLINSMTGNWYQLTCFIIDYVIMNVKNWSVNTLFSIISSSYFHQLLHDFLEATKQHVWFSDVLGKCKSVVSYPVMSDVIMRSYHQCLNDF